MRSKGYARLTLFERLLLLFTSVRPGEGRSVQLMLSQAFLLLLAYYLIRPVRDALILAEGTPEIRSYATGAVALALIFLIPLYKLLFQHLTASGSKSTVLRWVILFFISNLLLFWFLGWLEISVAVIFYIWVGVFSVMVVAQFWAFAADLYNIKSGQRLFAVIAVGGSLGAWVGSQIAERLFPVLGAYKLMLLSTALLTVVVIISQYAESSVPPGSRSISTDYEPEPQPRGLKDLLGGFDIVVQHRYLLEIAMFIMLLNWINSTGGYILATFANRYAEDLAAAGDIPESTVLGQFYGDFYGWTALLGLLFQLFLVSRIFRYLGIRGAILFLPAVMIANYGLIAVLPVFSLIRIMMILENSTNYSIQNTTNHALYLPLDRDQKYLGKTTIDTFFVRFGDLIQAGAVFIGWQLLGLQISAFVVLNLVLALALFAIGVAIGRQRRGEIRERLANLPPEIRKPLPDVRVPAGEVLMFSVPDQVFLDPDPGDSLSYRSRRADGRDLPRWVRFNRHNQTYTVCPPGDAEGRVDIELIATDFEGLSVHARFSIIYGDYPQPQFNIDDAATRPGAPDREAGADADTARVPRGYPR